MPYQRMLFPSSGLIRVLRIPKARITAESRSIQRVLGEVSVEAKQIRSDLEAKQESYQKAVDGFNAQLSVMSEKEKEKRKEQIRTIGEEIEELSFRFKREVKKAQDRAIDPMKQRIVDAVHSIAQSRQATVVLGSETLIYFDPSADFTDLVISALDTSK